MTDTADTSVRGWLAAICARFHPDTDTDQEPTMSTVTLTDHRRAELGDLVGDAVEDLVDDGKLTEAEAIELVESVLDWLVDLPDGVWRWAVAGAADLLRRDPAKMRARADRVEKRSPKRAQRIRERADRVEARQADPWSSDED